MIKIKKRDLFNPGKDIGLAEIIFFLGAVFTFVGIFGIIIIFVTWEFNSLYAIIRAFILGSLVLFFSVYKIGTKD